MTARLGGASVKYVIGNHGLEPGADLNVFEREIARIGPRLKAELASCPGVEVEDKRYSLAVHDRRSRLKRQARARIREAVAVLPLPMRVPERAPNKGDALLRLRSLKAANTALFVPRSGMADSHEYSELPVGPALDFLRHLWQLEHSLARLSRAMERRLTAQQRFIILCVGAYPGITAGQLAGVLHVDVGTMSAALRRLEDKALIERRRDPGDSRRAVVGLTHNGRQLDTGPASSSRWHFFLQPARGCSIA